MKSTQIALIDGKALTELDVLDAMDEVIRELHQTGDIERVVHVLGVMEKIENTSGHGKAKLLWGMKNWWEDTGQTKQRDVEFVDYIENSNILKKTSIDRYLVVQEHIEDLTIPKEFHSRPIRELVPIAKTLEQGYDIPKAVWSKLKIANGPADIGHILREEVKEKPARKSAMQIILERDGSIVLWKKNTRKHVGYLSVEDTDEDVRKAIDRIVDNSGIRRK